MHCVSVAVSGCARLCARACESLYLYSACACACACVCIRSLPRRHFQQICREDLTSILVLELVAQIQRSLVRSLLRSAVRNLEARMICSKLGQLAVEERERETERRKLDPVDSGESPYGECLCTPAPFGQASSDDSGCQEGSASCI